MRSIPGRALTGLVMLFVALAGVTRAVDRNWDARWRNDLDELARVLPEIHPDPFGRTSPDAFQGALDALAAEVPDRTHAELVVGLATVVASLGDGHTRVTVPVDPGSGFADGHSETPPPADAALVLSDLPVRFALLENGLVVARATPAYADLVGATVDRIGSRGWEDALERVRPTVRGDNRWHVRDRLPMHLALPGVLAATGVIADPAVTPLDLRLPDGTARTVRLSPRETRDTGWSDPPPAGPRDRYPERRHWVEALPPGDVLFLRLAESVTHDGRTIADLASDLEAALGRSADSAVILDVRGNPGGSMELQRPLIHALIRHRSLHRPGKLAMLIDGGTFSAAGMLVTNLERQLPVVFVGEPTGASPNHHGDSRKHRLTETGITVRISTLAWQSDPRDMREAVHPHIPIAMSVADWRAGRDPALEMAITLVRSGPRPVSLAADGGDWEGVISLGHEQIDLVMHLALDRSGEPSSGDGIGLSLDLPGLDAMGIPIDDGHLEGGTLVFTIPDRNPIEVRLDRYGPHLIGMIRRDGIENLAFLSRPGEVVAIR